MKNNELTDLHIWWGIVALSIVFIICMTIMYLQAHSWIIRFEMDNNTLEAIKSINWSAMPK
jgi:hypothetical protein